MADDYIKKALHEAVQELVSLYEQDNELKRRQYELGRQVFKLMSKIHSLAALCEDIPANSYIAQIVRTVEKTGLTAAIRNILIGTGEWLTPTQLREYLIRFRIDVTRYKNPLGSIHTILGRFVDSGDVEQGVDTKTKRPSFRWKPPDFVDRDDGELQPEQLAAALLEKRPRQRKKKSPTKPKALLAEGPARVK